MIQSKLLKVSLFNAGSLGTKHDEITTIIERESPDIVAINETWLRDREDGRAPTVPGYRLRHTPRPAATRRGRGGGVGFYVKRGISVRPLAVPHPLVGVAQTEQMWLSVNVKGMRFILGTAYRPPWYGAEDFFDALTDSISSFNNYDKVVLLGDFNINIIDTNEVKTRLLYRFLNSFNLNNHVNEPTHFTAHSQTVIDLICSDAPVTKVSVHYVPELGGHAFVTAELKIKKPKIACKVIKYRPLKSINLDIFNMDLEYLDWDSIITIDNVDDMVTQFNEMLLDLFDRHAPERQTAISERCKPWLTDTVRHIMRLRDESHTRYRKTNLDKDKTQYKSLKHLASVSLSCEKSAFFRQQINSNVKNSKLMWQNLKNNILSLNAESELPEYFNDANGINKHFLDVPGAAVAPYSYLTSFANSRYGNAMLKLETVNESTVAKYIIAVKTKAKGIDHINMDMLLLTLPRTLKVITAIINKSIETSTYPSLWKMALVRPIPKKPNPVDLKDLRPISILPCLSKILEKVVHAQVMHYCETQYILPLYQSGFRKRHSTATALLDVVDNILTSQDSGSGTMLALLDFSRAFDSINFSLMLAKMVYYGFDRNCLKWFDSYLHDRSQMVTIDKGDGTVLESTLRPLTRGIPQGSILGPLLFTLYTADVTNCIRNSMYHIYADDLQVYISAEKNNIHNAVKNINADLNRISEWSLRNCLNLNPTKTKFMVLGSRRQTQTIIDANPQISIEGVNIERVDTARNLGLLMDSRLSFEGYITEVVRTCFYRLRVLYNIRACLSQELRVVLCESLVLSKLNYCVTVYGPCLRQSSQRLIQRVQNACARYCFYIPPRTHVTPYLNNSRMLKMETRQKFYFACLLFDVIKWKQPQFLYKKLIWSRTFIENRLRFYSKVLDVPRHRTTAFRGSFRYLASKCWNNIPPPIRDCKCKTKFKTELKKFSFVSQSQA